MLFNIQIVEWCELLLFEQESFQQENTAGGRRGGREWGLFFAVVAVVWTHATSDHSWGRWLNLSLKRTRIYFPPAEKKLSTHENCFSCCVVV